VSGSSEPGIPPKLAGPRPNLFLVGAPKSGTTALATYLGEHPDVFMAPWELNYFGTDLTFRTATGAPSRIRPAHYLSTFSSHAEERYRGDHSVFYLYSRQAATEIRYFAPDARIVVMLRDPVDQMYSQHSEMLYQGDEDIRDFAEALEAEKDRALGRRIPPRCRKPFALQYRAVARYHDQVERYFSTFGRDHVCVVVYDDLARDTARAHRRVLDFLEVDPGHEPEFRVVNPNKAVRSTLLRDVLKATAPDSSPTFRRLGRMVVRSDSARSRTRRWLRVVNTKERPRPPMDPALRSQIQEELSDDVRRLEGLLEHELGAWLGPPG